MYRWRRQVRGSRPRSRPGPRPLLLEQLENRCLLAGSITEFTIPTAASAPEGITAGPDGNLWFTETAGNKIGRISPAGSLTEFTVPTPNSSPQDITAGADGNVWFTEGQGNKIGRISPTGAFAEFNVPTDMSAPQGIALAPDGSLWFTESQTDKIGRITPVGAINEITNLVSGSQPAEITFLGGTVGNFFFTEPGSNRIGQVKPNGFLAGETALPLAASNPQGITAGPDGNVWFTEIDGDRIGRLSPTGGLTEFALSTPDSMPQRIAPGPDNALWFTETGGNKIGRISTQGVFFEDALATTNAMPFGITLGPDGNLWFTENGANQIGKVVPTSLSRNDLFVAQAYRDLLHREADPIGQAAFSNVLNSGLATRSQVAMAIENSPESRGLVVQGFYTKFLGRSADSAGLNGWLSFLAQGGTAEQVEANILGSQEYFVRKGGTNAGFLTAVYQDVLNRPIDPAGATFWNRMLTNDASSRTTVALAILQSSESDQLEVQTIYLQFLHRPADAGGLATFVQALQSGTPNEVVIAAVIGSDEYFGRL
jgi:streptogramin lyase